MYINKKIKYNFDSTKFDLTLNDKNTNIKNIRNINVKLLGKHNVLNAAAALIVCLNLGANINIIKSWVFFFFHKLINHKNLDLVLDIQTLNIIIIIFNRNNYQFLSFSFCIFYKRNSFFIFINNFINWNTYKKS